MRNSVLVAVLLLSFSSCVTLKRCSEKFGSGTTHTVTHRDTLYVIDTVYVQPDSLQGAVSIDSLLSGKVDSLVHTSSSQKLQLKLWIDKYTRLLHYRADVKPDTVTIIKEIPYEVQVPCPNAVVMDPEKGLGWAGKLWKKFQFFSAYLVLAGIFCALIFYLLIRAKK